MLGVDLAAEIPKPAHEVANGLGLVATGDMLGAEVAVRHAVAQHAVAAHRRHDAVLLYVEARAPWMRDFHRVHPCGAARGPPRRGYWSCSEAVRPTAILWGGWGRRGANY